MDFDSAEYAWKDLEVIFLGRPIIRLLEVSYSVKSEKKLIRGRGKKALGIQDGNEDVKGQITVGQSEFEAMTRAVQDVRPGAKITDPAFSLNIAYRQEGSLTIVRDRIPQLKITEFEKGMKQGETDMEIKLPFIATDVLLNV
jgi:hypothetical protein